MDLSGVTGVVLAGGTGRRLGGADKAGLRWRDRTLLEHSLAALNDLGAVVVVGDPVPGLPTHPDGGEVRFVREDPPGGGPGAGLLAGLAAAPPTTRALAVLAVDMPGVTPGTLARLARAAPGHDGAILLSPDGRRQLALVVDAAALRAARPPGPADGLPVHRLLRSLDLAEVPAEGAEGVDVDTWDDLAALGAVTVEPVGPDRWERWARLRLAALADAPGAFGSRLADWADADEQRWRDRLTAPGERWIARGGPDPADVGMVAVQPDDAGGWHLISLWVDPSARGRGVTDALVGAVVDHARRAGGATVWLHVQPGNDRARAAYARLGFRPEPAAGGGHDGDDEDDEDGGIVLVRALDA